MNSRLLIALTTFVAALSVAVCAALSAPPSVSPQPPGDAAHLAQSKALYEEKCSACHNLYDADHDPKQKGYNRAQWQRTVDDMLTKHHASDSISPPEAAQIVDYLATFAPTPDTRRGRNTDPWATDADDVWVSAPSVTRMFNFEAPDALANFSPLAAGTPGPAPVWHLVPAGTAPDGTVAQVRLAKPAATRFGLLMDRKDQARNLDISVRFHIQSGKVSPAVGLVFGFTGPKTYDVLAYNAARNDLMLLKVAEPTHTPLQQTPVNLPAGGAATAAAVTPAPAPASGWHTLRLLVKDGQIHGWLDMTKRISTQDPGYQGGKVGLWAQGDTVAAFDDWTVDIYDGAAPTNGLGA